jgi:CDP-diacylglycerol--serine O-phosphatidyltransferase
MSDLNPKVGRPVRRGVFLLPNLLTTGTLFSGFYAIVAAIDGNFERAPIAIFIAMIFDGLDGRVARWTGTESAFGKEYDSLSDLVAFGLAPALVVYQWGVARLLEYNLVWGRIGWLVTFFYAASTAFRLARFNTRTAVVDKRFFEGLPSPSGAAVVAAFIWCAHTFSFSGLPALVAAFAVTALIGVFMTSRFYYSSFKSVQLTGRVKATYTVLVPLFFVVIALHPQLVLLSMSGAFALSGPVIAAWRKVRRRPLEGTGTP